MKNGTICTKGKVFFDEKEFKLCIMHDFFMYDFGIAG